MKGFIMISSILILTSCLEQVDPNQDQFIKVLGKEGSSIAERIVELENGDLMVLGRMGVAAHSLESGGTGFDLHEVEDQGPFIAITDQNGNLKNLRIYPIEDYYSEFFKIHDLRNLMTFQDAVKLSTGGYAVIGELRGFDFTPTITGIPEETDYHLPGSQNFTSFLFHIDENFNLVKIRSFNGGPDWSLPFIRTIPRIQRTSDHEITIFFGRKSILGAPFPTGYSFQNFDHNLELIRSVENFDANVKYGYDFDINDTGDLVVVGLEQNPTDGDGKFKFYKLPADNVDGSNEVKIDISSDGQLTCCNTNEHYIRALPNGNFMAILTGIQTAVKGVILDPNTNQVRTFNLGNREDYNNSIRAPRSIHIMNNGDALIYIINIPREAEPISGQLFRVTPEGEIKFEISLDGSPGAVVETLDGGIMVATNKSYNGLLQRAHLIKLDSNGSLY